MHIRLMQHAVLGTAATPWPPAPSWPGPAASAAPAETPAATHSASTRHHAGDDHGYPYYGGYYSGIGLLSCIL